MKILHLETGRHLYGGSLQVRYLIEGLSESGIENVLVCEQSSPLAQQVQPWASKIYPEVIKGDLDLAFIARLKKIIQSEQPDLVHLHSRRGCDVLGGIAAKLAGVPVVLSRRVDNSEPRWWAKLKYRLYDHVVTISEGIRCVLASEGVPLNKLSCVPSAVNMAQYQAANSRDDLKQLFGFNDQDFVIGVVAQLISRKGHRYLLEVLPKLRQQYPNLQLVFFGQGPLKSALEQQITDLGLSDCVTLAGFRDDLEKLLPQLDLLVHPAEIEGLGVSLLQAASAKVPIIATAAGGMPEIVRHGMTGLLVQPRDSQALKLAIESMISQPQQAAAMAEAAHQLVSVAFSIPAMVKGNLAVYKKLLAKESHE
jgi:glycosyltransferase involved in cell wall biosynthesis